MNRAIPALGLVFFGVLVGSLVGLSGAPVVAALLATLGSLVAGFLAVRLGTKTELTHATRLATALGCFALGGLAGVALGVATRTHDWLSPTPAAQIARLEAAGFSRAEAKAHWLGRVTAAQESGVPFAASSILFGNESGRSLVRYAPVVAQGSFDAVMAVFEEAGGSWSELAAALRELDAPEADKLALARLIFAVATEGAAP